VMFAIAAFGYLFGFVGLPYRRAARRRDWRDHPFCNEAISRKLSSFEK
jgi:hypothetical protein